jgi:hypothetical protein
VIVVLSSNAELENGFNLVAKKINYISKQVGVSSFVYGQEKTLQVFAKIIGDKNKEFYHYTVIENFDDNDIVEKAKTDNLYVFLSSRKQTVSFNFHVDNMPKILSKNIEFASFVLFYPEALKSLSDSQITEITAPPIQEKIEKIIQWKDKIKSFLKNK